MIRACARMTISGENTDVIVISTETQWNGEIYLELDLATLSTSLFPAALCFARNEVCPVKQ